MGVVVGSALQLWQPMLWPVAVYGWALCVTLGVGAAVVVAVGGWFALPDPSLNERFKSRYQAAFGEAPHPIAGLAYDGIAAIGALVKSGRSVDEVADTFGFEPSAVKRILALGNLWPRIRTLYRRGEIDVGKARALAENDVALAGVALEVAGRVVSVLGRVGCAVRTG